MTCMPRVGRAPTVGTATRQSPSAIGKRTKLPAWRIGSESTKKLAMPATVARKLGGAAADAHDGTPSSGRPRFLRPHLPESRHHAQGRLCQPDRIAFTERPSRLWLLGWRPYPARAAAGRRLYPMLPVHDGFLDASSRQRLTRPHLSSSTSEVRTRSSWSKTSANALTVEPISYSLAPPPILRRNGGERRDVWTGELVRPSGNALTTDPGSSAQVVRRGQGVVAGAASGARFAQPEIR